MTEEARCDRCQYGLHCDELCGRRISHETNLIQCMKPNGGSGVRAGFSEGCIAFMAKKGGSPQ